MSSEELSEELSSEKSEHFIKKWSDNLLHIRKDWYYKLVFISVLLQFHANNLKDSESALGWAIITPTLILLSGKYD